MTWSVGCTGERHVRARRHSRMAADADRHRLISSLCRSFTQRFTLQLDIGENAQDYSEIAKQEHLSGQRTGQRAGWREDDHRGSICGLRNPLLIWTTRSVRSCALLVQPSRLRCAS